MKTTIAGWLTIIAAVAGGSAQIIHDGSFCHLDVTLAAIMSGIGLIKAKDAS